MKTGGWAGVIGGGAAALALSVSASAQTYLPIDGFADLYDRLSPAVVNISTSQNISGTLPTFPPGSPLERFNDSLGGGGRTQESLGSGFVIDPDGVIITNNHVIEDADAIEIAFEDGLVLDAVIVGRDPATDLAVLRVEPDHALPYVSFGDSDAARVGDLVLAIGNPFGLGQTLTTGVISARNRDIETGNYDDFIQTDAAINRGNSGGPLFNMEGDVIGVNSAILSPTGGSVGIGFSIPSELAQTIIDQLLLYGETRRGWLGVTVRPVTLDIAEVYGLNSARGALVGRVTDESPAHLAGLQTGDLILTYDGVDVTSDRQLTRLVAETEAGETVAIEYMRQNELNMAMVVIEELDEGDEALGSALDSLDPPPAGSALTALGVTFGPLDDAARRRYNVPDDVDGVIVTEIQPGSDAAAKLRIGDVVEEIAWEKVASPQQASELIDAASEEGGPILLLINRNGRLDFISVRA
ncbi:MAG: Do family serine endopeptidase [Maricaulaceae bacterium]|jgi:serine protease Do